jgi:hypothetical protein
MHTESGTAKKTKKKQTLISSVIASFRAWKQQQDKHTSIKGEKNENSKSPDNTRSYKFDFEMLLHLFSVVRREFLLGELTTAELTSKHLKLTVFRQMIFEISTKTFEFAAWVGTLNRNIGTNIRVVFHRSKRRGLHKKEEQRMEVGAQEHGEEGEYVMYQGTKRASDCSELTFI